MNIHYGIGVHINKIADIPSLASLGSKSAPKNGPSQFNINFCTTSAVNDGYVTNGWNNMLVGWSIYMPQGGDAYPVFPLVDTNNKPLPTTVTITFGGIGWILPDVFGYGDKHGKDMNDVEYAPDTVGYIGLGGSLDSDENPPYINIDVYNLPPTPNGYQVSALIGWYENKLQWHLFDPAIPATWTGVDAIEGNTYTGSFGTNSFSLVGNRGHGVYAIQFIRK